MASACSMSGSLSLALSRAWLVLNGYGLFHCWSKPRAFSTTALERQRDEKCAALLNNVMQPTASLTLRGS